MASTCFRCNAATLPGDRFCANCGQRLTPSVSTASEDADHTLLLAAEATRQGGAPPEPRPWYRRWRLVVPVVVVGVMMLALGAGAWYIKTRFDSLNELSTPPPRISGDRLGGDEDLSIDTGPAQDAVREAAGHDPPPTTAPSSGTSGGGSVPGGSAMPQGTAVIELNAQGTPVLVSEPVGTPSLAEVPGLVEPDSTTFLMMGVDARPGEAIDVGVRPDSLFVVYLDGSTGSCRMLSIPRDTRTTLPGYGQSKINHALAVGGVPYERLVVENLLGIELEHYGLIDFAGVEKLVDAVGGITVDNAYPFSAGGHDFPAGTIELNGEQALTYSRFRGGPDGDFGRQERQQAVVRALVSRGAGMDAVAAIPSLVDTVGDHVRSDLGPSEMVDLAKEFRPTCNADTLETERLDGDVAWAFDDVMQMELSFVLVEPAEVRQKVSWLLTGSDEPIP